MKALKKLGRVTRLDNETKLELVMEAFQEGGERGRERSSLLSVDCYEKLSDNKKGNGPKSKKVQSLSLIHIQMCIRDRYKHQEQTEDGI